MSEAPLGFWQRRPLRQALRNWLERHQHPFNRGIHLMGIPLTLAGIVLVFVWWDAWYWGVLAFVAGYVLQWIGHLVEGNDLGEWAGIKRLFGLPYVAIAPRWQNPAGGPISPRPSSSSGEEHAGTH